MSPAPKNSVASRVIRIQRCPSEPGRDSPYAQSTDTAMLNSVPTTVTPTLTSAARCTWPPLSSSWYATNVMSRGPPPGPRPR